MIFLKYSCAKDLTVNINRNATLKCFLIFKLSSCISSSLHSLFTTREYFAKVLAFIGTQICKLLIHRWGLVIWHVFPCKNRRTLYKRWCTSVCPAGDVAPFTETSGFMRKFVIAGLGIWCIVRSTSLQANNKPHNSCLQEFEKCWPETAINYRLLT